MIRTGIATLLALVLLAAAVGGCGSSGSDSGSNETTAGGSASAGAEGESPGEGEAPGQGSGQSGEESGQGGNGGSAGSEKPQVPLGGDTRSSFIASADEVCLAAQKKMGNELTPYLSGSGNINTLKKKAPEISEKVLIPGLEQEIAELKALGGSEGEDAKAGAEMTAALEGMLAEAKSSPVGLLILQESTGAAESVASTYGFQECGRLV